MQRKQHFQRHRSRVTASQRLSKRDGCIYLASYGSGVSNPTKGTVRGLVAFGSERRKNAKKKGHLGEGSVKLLNFGNKFFFKS